jgi:hypothetical protein
VSPDDVDLGRPASAGPSLISLPAVFLSIASRRVEDSEPGEQYEYTTVLLNSIVGVDKMR